MRMDKYRHIFNSLFTAGERLQVGLLVLCTTLHGLVQVAGIASIMPFIAVVTNPDLVTDNEYLQSVYTTLGFADSQQFLIFLGVAAFVMLIFSNAVTTVSYWFTLRFCNHLEHDLACRLLASYLNKPYEFFLQKNTAELSKVILSEVQRVVSGILMATIGVISDTVLTVFIIGLLLLIDPWVTLVTFATLAVLFGLIFVLVRGRVTQLGQEFVRLNGMIFTRAREALEGVKEIKVLGRGQHFVDKYAHYSLQAARNSVAYRTMSLLPLQGLEALAFGGIIGITLYFMLTGENTGDTLSLVALYAFAAYRLLPAMNEIFDGVETIRYNAGALHELLDDYDVSAAEPAVVTSEPNQLALAGAIRLSDVTYCYPGQPVPAVEGLSLEIPANSSTCFVGDSGAGKSTAVDIILGLAHPQNGRVLIDGVPLGQSNVNQWQAKIGYVPQVIYLTDESVAQNIAFGVPREAIDLARVEEVARIANVHEFVVGGLADNYDTLVGERGLSLSGGQRQRIGIARALYHDPDVLILDEATNELDLITEAGIVNSLLAMPGKTVVFVSHKISLASRCNQIVLLRSGRAVASGGFSHLLATSAYFRELVDEHEGPANVAMGTH
jgi:ABC-type bacteriocin/lantibiotic exporter with double-glycine peptidase domain